MLRSLCTRILSQRGFAGRLLVANPKKLAKEIVIKKSVPFLHKDVRLRRVQMSAAPSDAVLSQLCEKVMHRIAEGSSSSNLQSFYNAYLEKLGGDSFHKFIKRHEAKFPTLINSKHFFAYLKSCSEWFKHDEKLLKLFTECNWKQVTMKAIPKIIAEEEFDSKEKDEMRLSSYRDQMPPANPLFNLYVDNLSEDESESNICKPEFIQNESDIPSTFYSDSSDETGFAIKSERSLEEFLKRQGVHDEKRVLDIIPLLKEAAFFDPSPSPFIYVQLEYGDDSILTKSAVMKVLKAAGIEDVKSVYIMNKILAIIDEEPDLDSSLLDAELKGNPEGVDKQKLVQLSEAARQSPLSLPLQEALQDEQLTGTTTQSSEMEKDKQRIKEIFKFSMSVPRRNQTHGFIEFRTIESKAQMLKTNYRLFGMEINGGLMVTEDADYKRTLRVGNLPWSLSPVHFVNFLNKIIASSGETVQFHCPEAYKNTVSDASYLCLQLGSFTTAFKLCKFLNKEMYRGRPLQVDFKHGCAKYVQGRYVEHYHTAFTLESERLHISHRTLKKQQALEEALVNN